MTLVIGYGNPGRGDDGLGPEFVKRLEHRALTGVRTLSSFQLTVEHAIEVAASARVVFVDASLGTVRPYRLTELEPACCGDIGSHSVSPTAVLALAKLYYDANPPAYLLEISGERFDRIHEGLSAIAEQNLTAAEVFFVEWLKGRTNRPKAPHRPEAEGKLSV